MHQLEIIAGGAEVSFPQQPVGQSTMQSDLPAQHMIPNKLFLSHHNN